MRNTRRYIASAVLAAAIIIGIVIRHPGSASLKQIESGMRFPMGTYARIVAVAPTEQQARIAIERGMEEIETVDTLMSDYDEQSEISRVNREAAGTPVIVSEPTFEVLRKSVEFSRLSDGAFDVTIGPIGELWRQAAKSHEAPDANALAEARTKVGYDKLLLDPNDRSVRFTVEGMKLDLGGIAKGYAIDLAVDAMQRAGATGGMVDIGGDIRCFGRPETRSHWRIGLQDPAQGADPLSQSKTLLVLEFNDAAVATSGDYRRFGLIDDEKVSHIIDKSTAAGARSLTSVTIIASQATDADALATAASVLGPQKGLKLVEDYDDAEAILIPAADPDTVPEELKLLKTSRAQDYVAE